MATLSHCADADGVGVGEVGYAVGAECNVRMRVVHHADGLVRQRAGRRLAAKLWASPRVWPVSCAASWRIRMQDYGEHGVVGRVCLPHQMRVSPLKLRFGRDDKAVVGSA